MGQTRFEEFPGTARELIDITAHGDWDEVSDQVNFKRGRPAFDSLAGPAGVKRALDYAVKYLGVVGPEQAKSPNVPQNQQGVAERMLPKSAFAGSDKNKLGPAAHAKGKQKGPVKKGQFVGGMEEEKKKGADGKACWKGYRYAGTKNGKDKCVPVSEDVENIMATLINKIIFNEAVQNNK
jgi:hypothetical protein